MGRLFYGQNNWVGKAMGQKDPKQNLFRGKRPMMDEASIEEPTPLPDYSDPALDESQAVAESSPRVPLFKKRMMEDSPLARGSFNDTMDVGYPKPEVMADKPIASNEDPQDRPKLFGNNQPQRGPEMAQADTGMDEYGIPQPKMKKYGLFSSIFPGLPSRKAIDESNQAQIDNYIKMRGIHEPTADIKTLLALSKLPKEAQELYLKSKTASSMNPLAMARFDWQQDEAEDKKRIRGEEQTDRYVEKLKNSLGDVSPVISSLQAIKDELGFDYNDYDPETEEAVDAEGNRTKKDLPGVNLFGAGRMTLHSKEAQNLEAAVSRLFNKELKARSGAAVVQQELDRLKKEFESGKFNTESQMIKALQDYEKIMEMDLKSIEAGYSPEVVKEYQERGGATSKSLMNKDREALKWLQENPNDPGAEGVRAMLKKKGKLKDGI